MTIIVSATKAFSVDTDDEDIGLDLAINQAEDDPFGFVRAATWDVVQIEKEVGR